MSDMWNYGQSQVIENTKGDMIVSASAGSGKTSVMIERVTRLVIDKKIPVSRILMLSFNEAIASEIKEKMAKALIEAIKTTSDKEFLREQIDALGMADMTTLHSFCNSIIKQYFDVVGVDPAYSIMDEKESKVIINKCINEVFDDYFESGDADFLLLKDKLSDSSDDNLRTVVKEIFEYSNTLVGGEEWLDEAIKGNYMKDLDKTKPIKYLIIDIRNKINDALDAIETAMHYFDINKFPELDEMYRSLLPYEHEESILGYQSFMDKIVTIPRRINKDPELKEVYNNAKNTYKEVVSTISSLYPVSFDIMKYDHKQDGIITKKLIEIVKRFKVIYNREKAEVNKLDFNDMEHLAMEILSHDDIAETIRNKYDYVCIDEYQDINIVQDAIISKIEKGDNLLMVGDPKQSIYGFRFTEPEIFVRKVEEYEKSKDNHMVKLDLNYRSSPLILKYVNKVFDNIMVSPRAGMISRVYSSLANGQDFVDQIKRPFEVMLYEKGGNKKEKVEGNEVYRISQDRGSSDIRKDAEIEAEYINSKVRELLTSKIYDIKTHEYRDVKFDDMVILAQSRNETVKVMLDILEDYYELPIDATYLKKKDEPQEVKILLDFLRAIDNPRQDVPLYTVMKMFFDFEDEEIVAMRRIAGKTDYFHNVVFDTDIQYERLRDKISSFRRAFDEYRVMSTFMNVHDFLLSAIERLGFKRKLLMSKNGRASIDNIDKFLLSLKDKRHASTIQEFLYAYDNYDIENDVDATSQNVKDSIHTSTIHQSKGLEYPIVFIVNAGNPFVGAHMSKAQFLLERDTGIAVRTFNEEDKTVYSNWLIQGIINKKVMDEVEEKMRLLYVAMTRAKNCLYIVGSVAKEKKSINSTHKYTDILYHIGEMDMEFADCIEYRVPDEADDVIVHAIDNSTRAFRYDEYSEEDKARYKSVFDYKYPHEDATHLAQKYTVTSINHEEREKEEYVPELYETEKTSIGSIYHKFMEHVNYEANTIEAIKAEMSRMIEEKILTQEEIGVIDIDDVYKCLNSSIIVRAKDMRHEREKKFMMSVPLSQVKEGASDEKVIIQGIADLVIYGDKNILVDFKKSSQPSFMLKETYQKQIDLYKFALEDSMGITFDEMYLYVIGRDELIDMKH